MSDSDDEYNTDDEDGAADVAVKRRRRGTEPTFASRAAEMKEKLSKRVDRWKSKYYAHLRFFQSDDGANRMLCETCNVRANFVKILL